MKSMILVLGISGFLFSSSAFAFITTINVEKNGQVKTVDSADDIKFEELDGSGLSYNGNADEAIMLLMEIAGKTLPEGLTEYASEVNPKSGTIAMIISVQGTFGYSYIDFVVKKASE